jgi:hypothetical protein
MYIFQYEALSGEYNFTQLIIYALRAREQFNNDELLDNCQYLMKTHGIGSRAEYIAWLKKNHVDKGGKIGNGDFTELFTELNKCNTDGKYYKRHPIVQAAREKELAETKARLTKDRAADKAVADKAVADEKAAAYAKTLADEKAALAIADAAKALADAAKAAAAEKAAAAKAQAEEAEAEKDKIQAQKDKIREEERRNSRAEQSRKNQEETTRYLLGKQAATEAAKQAQKKQKEREKARRKQEQEEEEEKREQEKRENEKREQEEEKRQREQEKIEKAQNLQKRSEHREEAKRKDNMLKNLAEFDKVNEQQIKIEQERLAALEMLERAAHDKTKKKSVLSGFRRGISNLVTSIRGRQRKKTDTPHIDDLPFSFSSARRGSTRGPTSAPIYYIPNQMRSGLRSGLPRYSGPVRVGGKRRTFKHHKKTKNKKRSKRKTKARH